MSFSNVDWCILFRVLPAWRTLSPGARRFLIRHVTPSQQLSPEKAGAAGDELLEAGLLVPTGRGRSLMVPEPLRPIVLLLRAMHRQRPFDDPSDGVLLGYLGEHFVDQELANLVDDPSPFFRRDVRGDVADAAASGEGIKELLDAPAKGKAGDAQRLVRELLPYPAGGHRGGGPQHAGWEAGCRPGQAVAAGGAIRRAVRRPAAGAVEYCAS